MKRKKFYMIGIIAIIGMLCLVGYWETHYNREATVVRIVGDKVTVVDTTNEKWSFYGDGYKIDEKVVLKMNTNGTDSNIYDDVIENVKPL